MLIRIVTAIIALLLFVPIVWFGSWPLEVVMTALAVLGMSEFLQMKKTPLKSFPAFISMLGVAGVVMVDRLTPFIGEQGIVKVILAVVVLLLAYSLKEIDFTTYDIGSIILLLAYVGIGFSSFVALRSYSLPHLALVILVIWGTDSGAYLIGRKIGKNKLAPSVSPNKTIEGSIGGAVVAALISMVFLHFYPLFDSYILSVFFMVVLSVVGQAGDLIESKIKREFKVKDSGNLLPGHGGILDRFDSTLLVLNVIFILGIL